MAAKTARGCASCDGIFRIVTRISSEGRACVMVTLSSAAFMFSFLAFCDFAIAVGVMGGCEKIRIIKTYTATNTAVPTLLSVVKLVEKEDAVVTQHLVRTYDTTQPARCCTSRRVRELLLFPECLARMHLVRVCVYLCMCMLVCVCVFVNFVSVCVYICF